MLEIFVAFCFGLALAELAAFIAIQFRYGIPQAPWYFRVALAPPLLIGVSALANIGFIASTGEVDTIAGLDSLGWASVYVVTQFFSWWILVFYAIYHQLRIRRRRRRRHERMDNSNNETEQG